MYHECIPSSVKGMNGRVHDLAESLDLEFGVKIRLGFGTS